MIRKDTHIFKVKVDGSEDPHIIKDIYITEPGYILVSVYNEKKKVCTNYTLSKIQDILPDKIKIIKD
jgi:hypothetical protein